MIPRDRTVFVLQTVLRGAAAEGQMAVRDAALQIDHLQQVNRDRRKL